MVLVEDAASGVEHLFRELQQACADYGIVLDPLSPEDVLQIFKECDYDNNTTLDSREFADFYASVVTYAAMKACEGFGRSYGVGMAVGVGGVLVLKGVLRRLPVVGGIASPLLCLFPSIIVGPLLGIAAVYGMKQNDLFAFRHKLFPPRQAPLKQ